jgi:hypothetical protein
MGGAICNRIPDGPALEGQKPGEAPATRRKSPERAAERIAAFGVLTFTKLSKICARH